MNEALSKIILVEVRGELAVEDDSRCCCSIVYLLRNCAVMSEAVILNDSLFRWEREAVFAEDETN